MFANSAIVVFGTLRVRLALFGITVFLWLCLHVKRYFETTNCSSSGIMLLILTWNLHSYSGIKQTKQ